MYPRRDAGTTFKYPRGRLLKLQGLITEHQMKNPEMFDLSGESCLFVIKNGKTTGVTIGRASSIFSFIRQSFDDGTHRTSMEWAIIPYDNQSGVFSAPGDSGSVNVDGRGRFGALLAGGTGNTDSSDITYATPLFWLLPHSR